MFLHTLSILSKELLSRKVVYTHLVIWISLKIVFVDPSGFEPKQAESKSAVLPLHHVSFYIESHVGFEPTLTDEIFLVFPFYSLWSTSHFSNPDVISWRGYTNFPSMRFICKTLGCPFVSLVIDFSSNLPDFTFLM